MTKRKGTTSKSKNTVAMTIDLDKLEKAKEDLRRGLGFLNVLSMALHSAESFDEGTPQEIIESLSEIAFQAEDLAGTGLVFITRFLEEQKNSHAKEVLQ